jgi:L-ribulose-5-phosphate 3-epimerase
VKLLGHTLGTPGYTLEQALRLFGEASLDGAEVIWQDGYGAAISESQYLRDARRARDVSDALGVPILVLTPYVIGLNHPDETRRREAVGAFGRCLETAEIVGASKIRVYAGQYLDDDVADAEIMRAKLVESLTQLGPQAAAAGVVLCVENHFGTMAVSAAETAALVRDVGHPNVGILYDQANLAFTHCEDYPQAIALHGDAVRHVHAKDLVFLDREAPIRAKQVHRLDPDSRTVRSKVIGEGVLPWPAILSTLMQNGYDDTVSIEYEARWAPELPPPDIGIPKSAAALRHACEAAAELMSTTASGNHGGKRQ